MKGKTAKKTAISPRNGAVIPLGAHPGNTGGKKGRSGRPKNELRDALRQGLDEVLPRIRAALDDPNVKLADLVRVAEFQARYGIGTQQEHSGVGEGPLEVRVTYDDDGTDV